MKRLLPILLLLGVCINRAESKDLVAEVSQYFKLFSQSGISYSYQVKLVDKQKNLAIDSLEGKLYKSGKYYLDSTATTINLVNSKFYLKIDNERKSGLLLDLDLMKKKLGYEVDDEPNAMMILPDSMIRKYTQITVDSNNKEKSYKVLFTNSPVKQLNIQVNRATGFISGMTLTMSDPNDEDYLKICSIKGVSTNLPDNIFDLTKFGTTTSNGFTLKGRFSKYKLTSLI